MRKKKVDGASSDASPAELKPKRYLNQEAETCIPQRQAYMRAITDPPSITRSLVTGTTLVTHQL